MRTIRLRFIFTFLYSLCAVFGQAQVIMGNLEFDEKKFPGRESECKAASKAFETGDGFFMRGPVYFEQALEYYLKAQDFNSHNADLNYQIGLCYLNLNKDRLKALPFLERAQELKQDMGASFLFDLGMAYQYSLEFTKAIKVYKAYIAALGADAKPKANDFCRKI
jgi:tetratricopeptide (TPR) repeat protein